MRVGESDFFSKKITQGGTSIRDLRVFKLSRFIFLYSHMYKFVKNHHFFFNNAVLLVR